MIQWQRQRFEKFRSGFEDSLQFASVVWGPVSVDYVLHGAVAHWGPTIAVTG